VPAQGPQQTLRVKRGDVNHASGARRTG
jgi:hypothetical protein